MKPQSCGPIDHFHARERDETLHVIARCTACDVVLQPLSEDQVSQMRRGIALIRRAQRRPTTVTVPR